MYVYDGQCERDHRHIQVLEAKLDALERLVDEKFKASREALQIQANEYERRLSALNGEASRLREMQSTYLPREVYEKSGMVWKQTLISAIVAIIVAGIAAVIRYTIG